ncbi:MAG: hypothetical protein V9E90_10160 [Saprospiraceae bacterium]
MKNWLLLLTTFLLISACKEKDCCDYPEADYLVFGLFYGNCSGPKCIAIFKLSDSLLLEDSLDNYPSRSNFYEGQYSQRPIKKYVLAEKLRSQFPSQFLTDTQRVFGIPDAHDQGGVYLEYKSQTFHNFWILDTSIDRLPDAYKAYTELVKETVDKLLL